MRLVRLRCAPALVRQPAAAAALAAGKLRRFRRGGGRKRRECGGGGGGVGGGGGGGGGGRGGGICGWCCCCLRIWPCRRLPLLLRCLPPLCLALLVVALLLLLAFSQVVMVQRRPGRQMAVGGGGGGGGPGGSGAGASGGGDGAGEVIVGIGRGRLGRHPPPQHGLGRRVPQKQAPQPAAHPPSPGSASVPGAGPGSAAKTAVKSSPPVESFKIEPLLRRDAPSAELAAQVALNEARASALAALIRREADVERARVVAKERREGKAPKMRPKPPADCLPVPPDLEGPLDINLNHTSGPSLPISSFSWWSALGSGGSWRPLHCTPRHIVAIVIPYRDRWQHLLTLLSHLHPILQKQQVAYRIVVVEQHGNDTFNKGAIMNAAFRVVLQNAGTMVRWNAPDGSYHTPAASFFHCFVFHDVDLIPEDDRNMYSCPEHPRHMSVAVDELNYRLPYKVLVGGVFAIRTEHFFRVNGYSNLYWGWGGEDDDMGYRVQQAGLVITRPPEWIARYTMIKHIKRKPLAWRVRNKLLRTSGRRYRLDGLNTAVFKLLAISEHHLYTRILVDVGSPPANIRAIQAQADAPATTPAVTTTSQPQAPSAGKS